MSRHNILCQRELNHIKENTISWVFQVNNQHRQEYPLTKHSIELSMHLEPRLLLASGLDSYTQTVGFRSLSLVSVIKFLLGEGPDKQNLSDRWQSRN